MYRIVPYACFLLHDPEKQKYTTTRTRTLGPDRTAAKLLLRYSTGKIKSNPPEPHFQTSATMSWCMEGAITAVALPHCSESTKESIAGWWTFGIETRLELWLNYRTSYVKKTEVEVLPVVDLSAESAFSFFFCGRCNTGVGDGVASMQYNTWTTDKITPVMLRWRVLG